jgi:DNA transposition AAA+ family ATPase
MATTTKKHKKQHDLRGSSLARLAQEFESRADELENAGSGSVVVDEAVQSTLRELAKIFKRGATTERKLR